MNMLLPLIALIFAVGSFVRPSWPLLGVAVILLAVDAMIRSKR